MLGRKIIQVGAVVAVLAAGAAGTAHPVSAASGLHFTFAPTPIAPPHTLANSAPITVTLTAFNGSNVPVAGENVNVSLQHQDPGNSGGSATVGTTTLSNVGQPFLTDGSGNITINYVAPADATTRTTGRDVLVAADVATPGVTASDVYDSSTVTGHTLLPNPIAPSNSLAAGSMVSVTLTASPTSVPADVYLNFAGPAPGAGGGSASVGTTPLTSTFTRFTTDASGNLTITFTAPTSGGGTDTINSENYTAFSKVTATDSYTYAPPPPAKGVYKTVNPFRVADTRPGSGQPLAGQTLGAGQADNVPIVGVDGVPANATAAVLNVTATDGTLPSYITAYPGGTSVPLASNLNFTAHQTIANLVTVPIGGNGGVGIYNHSGRADVIVDLEGYFVPGTSPSAGLYNPLSPARVTDTRPGSGQQNAGSTMSTGSTLAVPVGGFGGVPGSGVSAVVLNVTAVNSSLPSFFTVFAAGTSRPNASNLNFTPGRVVPNRVIVRVGSGGKVDIFNQQGHVDVVVDVGGWFSDTGGTGAGFTAVAPARVADTRPGSGKPLQNSTLGSGSTRSVPIAGVGGVPATGVVAVAANVTVTDTNHSSFLTVYPDATPRPLASDLNWVAGQVVPNLSITQLGTNGAIAVYNSQGRVDVIVDVFGYWS